MLGRVWDAVFGCWHSHYSFPITVKAGSRRGQEASLTGTYVVCLDCGREFPYDWDEMKIVGSTSGQARNRRELVTKEAA